MNHETGRVTVPSLGNRLTELSMTYRVTRSVNKSDAAQLSVVIAAAEVGVANAISAAHPFVGNPSSARTRGPLEDRLGNVSPRDPMSNDRSRRNTMSNMSIDRPQVPIQAAAGVISLVHVECFH